MTSDDNSAYITWKVVMEADAPPAVQDQDGHTPKGLRHSPHRT